MHSTISSFKVCPNFLLLARCEQLNMLKAVFCMHSVYLFLLWSIAGMKSLNNTTDCVSSYYLSQNDSWNKLVFPLGLLMHPFATFSLQFSTGTINPLPQYHIMLSNVISFFLSDEGSGELTPVSSSELKFNWSDSEVNNESDNDMMHLEANEEEKTLTSTMKETDQLKAALKAHIEAQNKLSSQVCADGTSAGTINEVVSASGEPLERTEPDIAVGSSKKCEKVSRFRVDFPQYDTTSQASALPDSNASSDKES